MNKMSDRIASRIQRLYDLTNHLATVLAFSGNAQYVIIKDILDESTNKLRKSHKLIYNDLEFANFESDMSNLCHCISSNRFYDASSDLNRLMEVYS